MYSLILIQPISIVAQAINRTSGYIPHFADTTSIAAKGCSRAYKSRRFKLRSWLHLLHNLCHASRTSLYWTASPWWFALHHNPLPAVLTPYIVPVLVHVRLRSGARAHLARLARPVADFKSPLFDNLERKGLAIGALTARILRLLAVRELVRIRVGRFLEDNWEHFCKQRFATRETAADDADGRFDADDDEKDGAVPCR
jgi:hypothetical protein